MTMILENGQVRPMTAEELAAVAAMGPTLAQAQAAALATIDAGAEAARLQFMTPGAGQALTYKRKADQATALLAAWNNGAGAFSTTDPAYAAVANEVGITAPATADQVHDMVAVAQIIAQQNAAFQKAGDYIERQRLGAKAAVRAATTPEAVQAAQAVVWLTPQSLAAAQ